MPIRINLKEIFPSDPQEINVEKVNFNFNKLLELGVGTPGPIGLTGPQGPAGPIGLDGPPGIRGATWWVDSNTPTTHTFTGLLDGDLYLDNVNFDVWCWDSATSTWTLEVGISTIINNYLAINGSPFVKTLGKDPAHIDPRFIAFSQRNGGMDILRGTLNTSSNNQLFLHNFDETSTSIYFPADPKILYNSLTSIFANHADGQSSLAAEHGRYHIELGSLYNDGSLTNKLSDVKHNLKINFYKDYIATPQLSPTNDNNWVNTAKFSLSLPEDFNPPLVDQNGLFDFVTPKLNKQNSGSIIRDELNTFIGPWEAVVEQNTYTVNHVVADGITFALRQEQISSTLGLAINYVSSYSRLSNTSLAMLDTSSDIDGILLNNKTYIIGDTNVIGKMSIGDIDPTSYLTLAGNASIGDGYKSVAAPTNGAIIEGKVGIGTSTPSAVVHITNTTTTDDSFLVEDEASIDSTPFVIKNSGRVGIGLDTPTANFHIKQSLADFVTMMPAVKVNIANSAQSTLSVTWQGVGINIDDPTTDLHVVGSIRMVDTHQHDGAVMRSDASGNAKWSPYKDIGVPTGAITAYAGSTAPDGWLECNGQSLGMYPTLSSVIGASNVPDLRGAFIIGASTFWEGSNVGANADGGIYARNTHNGKRENYLAQAQIPAHSHEMRDVDGNGATVNITSSGSHRHDFYYDSGSGTSGKDVSNGGWGNDKTPGTLAESIGYSSHTHSNSDFAGHTGNGKKNKTDGPQLTWNGSTATSPVNNLPPYYALIYIIKY
jgi:microcystin-dependent protein